jgi:hypothetical protein
MNLVQLANDLEYVPKDQLAQMSQDPNSSYPAYLVLSEIQRRTLNEKNYQAMQERPTTTVAEEVVGEFMQPQLAENQSQGLQVGAPQSATPLPDSNISAGLSGVPTAPMQMAASGGITGYAEGNQTALEESFNNPYENMSAQAQGMTGAGLGMDSLGEGLEDSYNKGKSFLSDRYTEDDDTTDWGRLGKDALAASLFTPYGAIRGAGAKVLSTGAGLLSAAGRQQLKKQLGRFSAKNVPFIGIRNKKTGQFLSQEQIGANTFNKFIRNPLLLGGAFALVTEDDEAIKTPAPAPTPSPSPENIETNSSAGLSQAKDNTGNWRDLARLGAGIMSAKTVGDIGGTVTNILDAQDKRGLIGLQSKFTQAQTDQILATTKAMPLEKKLATLQSLGKLFEKISSGEIEVTEEQKASYALQYQILNDEVLKMQGIASSGSKFLTEAEQKIFNQAKAG